MVEDEVRIARLIRANLAASGYSVALAASGLEALEEVDRFDPDLILLDVMLPGMDGLAVLERLRSFSQVPVILVTAKEEPADRVHGLDLGADDYLTKPFIVEELLARVRAVIRRSRLTAEPKAQATIEVGPLVIRLAEHRVEREGRELSLTPLEFKLLAHLAIHQGRPLTHDALLTQVWGAEYRGALEYLRVAIARLRRKVEADPAQPGLIRNVHGVGYMLARPDDMKS